MPAITYAAAFGFWRWLAHSDPGAVKRWEKGLRGGIKCTSFRFKARAHLRLLRVCGTDEKIADLHQYHAVNVMIDVDCKRSN